MSRTGESGISRRGFVRLEALAGTFPAASALTACDVGGSGENARPNAEETRREAAPETTGEAPASGGYIARESEVSPGSAVRFEDSGQPASLVRLRDGSFAAYSAVCTHRGCTVSYNASRGTLDCPCHGSVFDPANGGEASRGPAEAPLTEIPVEERDGEVRRV